jgi:hypothetical protein
MEKQISRRSFLKKSAIALGTIAICDFKGIGSADHNLTERLRSSKIAKQGW